MVQGRAGMMILMMTIEELKNREGIRRWEVEGGKKRDCLSLYEGVCMKRFVFGGVELMIVIQTFVTNQ